MEGALERGKGRTIFLYNLGIKHLSYAYSHRGFNTYCKSVRLLCWFDQNPPKSRSVVLKSHLSLINVIVPTLMLHQLALPRLLSLSRSLQR